MDAIAIDWLSEEPPTKEGTTERCRQQGPLTTGAASSVAIPIAGVPAMGEVFVTFIISTNPCRLVFGDANVAAATANSALHPVGKYRYRICNLTSNFRHIQQTGAGAIDFWISSR
jgi:hypothetical protein